MIEKLIENWLINVHELGYQFPFCEALLTEKFTVLHVSRHGRGEHGKDIVARDLSGQLYAFQLKGGDISLPTWHEIRGEVEELVRLPVSITVPSISKEETHIPILVTNGELRGDAPTSIEGFADTWVKLGAPRLQIWQRHRLLSMFINAHGTYLPTELTDFREFVELYVSDFHDRLPRKKLAQLLAKLVGPPIATGRGRKTKRAIESMVLLGSYLVEPYERVENHVSAAEGWTLIAITILHIAERECLPNGHYQPSLALVWQALNGNLQRLRREVTEREHFVEPKLIFAETDFIRGIRTLLTLGWLTAETLIRILKNEEEDNRKEVLEVIKKNMSSLRLSGEADWPALTCLSLFLERAAGSSAAEGLLENWVQSIIEANRGKEAAGVPPPYWLQDKVLAAYYGQLPPYKTERFVQHSYTIHSALDMLVRRLCRQYVSKSWPHASRLHFCDYTPDSSSDWFLWRSETGNFQSIIPQLSISWSVWRRNVSVAQKDSVPSLLLKHPEWILPFVLTYPHRLNRSLSAVIDVLFGGRATIV
jgi:hypothetical protein